MFKSSVSNVYCAFLKDTFTRAKNWVKELQRQASPNIVIALSGNKADLANKRVVDFQVEYLQMMYHSNCNSVLQFLN